MERATEVSVQVPSGGSPRRAVRYSRPATAEAASHSRRTERPCPARRATGRPRPLAKTGAGAARGAELNLTCKHLKASPRSHAHDHCARASASASAPRARHVPRRRRVAGVARRLGPVGVLRAVRDLRRRPRGVRGAPGRGGRLQPRARRHGGGRGARRRQGAPLRGARAGRAGRAGDPRLPRVRARGRRPLVGQRRPPRRRRARLRPRLPALRPGPPGRARCAARAPDRAAPRAPGRRGRPGRRRRRGGARERTSQLQRLLSRPFSTRFG